MNKEGSEGEGATNFYYGDNLTTIGKRNENQDNVSLIARPTCKQLPQMGERREEEERHREIIHLSQRDLGLGNWGFSVQGRKEKVFKERIPSALQDWRIRGR